MKETPEFVTEKISKLPYNLVKVVRTTSKHLGNCYGLVFQRDDELGVISISSGLDGKADFFRDFSQEECEKQISSDIVWFQAEDFLQKLTCPYYHKAILFRGKSSVDSRNTIRHVLSMVALELLEDLSEDVINKWNKAREKRNAENS